MADAIPAVAQLADDVRLFANARQFVANIVGFFVRRLSQHVVAFCDHLVQDLLMALELLVKYLRSTGSGQVKQHQGQVR